MKSNQTKQQRDFETIGNMAGSIANDFNNLLNIIGGYAAAICDNLIPKTRAHEDALRILDATRHAEALTKRLISISKASSPKDADSKLEPVNTTKAVEEAVSLTKDTLASSDVTVEFKQPRTTSFINADYSQLIDCLMHLFFNAADAMPGGGSITVDISQRKHDNKTSVVIRVCDTGEGIPGNRVAQIFEPFYTTRKKNGAMGLGLTVVQNSVFKWGGMVKVRSKEGAGSNFRLLIPRMEQKKSQVKTTARKGGENILIIDDNRDFLTSMQKILSEQAYKITVFPDGKKAVDFFARKHQKIDLVMIDFSMVGRNGKRIKREILDINPNVPIIMTSGFSRDYVKSQLERDRWNFLQKPVEEDHLINTVEQALDENTRPHKKILNSKNRKK